MAVYPAGLPRPIDAGFTRAESSYISTVQRHSGTPFYNINADDAPMTFGLTWRFTRNQMEAFRDWLEADNFAALNGEQFDINLPTDTGIILQSVSFAPDGAPKIDAITGWVYTVSATVIARSYAENIPAVSFNTPPNDFAYYFYSQYQYPDILPNPIDSGYRKAEARRFNLGDVSSGSFAKEIQTDDSPVVYDLTFVLPINLEPIFRAWLSQDDFNMLKGAPFNMPIVTEYGVIIQVVQFVDGGQPQQSSMTLRTKTFTARVAARRQMNSHGGLTDPIFAVGTFLITEYGDNIVTESGLFLMIED